MHTRSPSPCAQHNLSECSGGHTAGTTRRPVARRAHGEGRRPSREEAGEGHTGTHVVVPRRRIGSRDRAQIASDAVLLSPSPPVFHSCELASYTRRDSCGTVVHEDAVAFGGSIGPTWVRALATRRGRLWGPVSRNAGGLVCVTRGRGLALLQTLGHGDSVRPIDVRPAARRRRR